MKVLTLALTATIVGGMISGALAAPLGSAAPAATQSEAWSASNAAAIKSQPRVVPIDEALRTSPAPATAAPVIESRQALPISEDNFWARNGAAAVANQDAAILAHRRGGR